MKKLLFSCVMSVCVALGVQAETVDVDFADYEIGGAFYGTIEAVYDLDGKTHSKNYNFGEYIPDPNGIPVSSAFQTSWSHTDELKVDDLAIAGAKAVFEGGTQASVANGTAGGATLSMTFGGQVGSDASDGKLKNNEVQVSWDAEFTNPFDNNTTVKTSVFFELTIPSASDSKHPTPEYLSSDGTTLSNIGTPYGFLVGWQNTDPNLQADKWVQTVAVPYSADEQTIQVVADPADFAIGATYDLFMVWTFQAPEMSLNENQQSLTWVPSVAFSMPVPIPEPTSLTLLGLGGLALLRRSRRAWR